MRWMLTKTRIIILGLFLLQPVVAHTEDQNGKAGTYPEQGNEAQKKDLKLDHEAPKNAADYDREQWKREQEWEREIKKKAQERAHGAEKRRQQGDESH
jgi:hypothetical protein